MAPLTRRKLLSSTASLIVVAPALALVGCAGSGSVPADVQKIANYASAIAAAFNIVVTALGDMPGLTSEIWAKMRGYVGTLQAVAVALSKVSTTDGAAPLVEQLVAGSNALLGALRGLGVGFPLWVSDAMSAVTVLLPILETLVGMFTTQRRRLGREMSEQEAYSILLATSVRR